MATYDRTTQDAGNVLSLDHLNVTIGDQQTATLFYVVGLGLTRDPYLTVGLDNMWLNAGRQQFHVPTRPDGQVVRGRIGLVVPDLDGLKSRLAAIKPGLEGTLYDYEEVDGHVEVTCPWGNHFHCTGPIPGFRARFGVPFIEFNVPSGAADGIARFYRSVLGALATVGEVEGSAAAVVRAGPDQTMVFREEPSESRPYDGHHIAVYLADFSSPHTDLDSRGLVTEESNEHQYRFTNIVDPETNEVLYELEHEVRSMRHPMFQRALVNRDPSVAMGNYRPGSEYLIA